MSDLTDNVDLQSIGHFLFGMHDRLRIIRDDIAEMTTDLREIRGRVAMLEVERPGPRFLQSY
jgi:hypothetical protein